MQYAEKVGDPGIISLLNGNSPKRKEADSKPLENKTVKKQTAPSSLKGKQGVKSESYQYQIGQRVLHSRDKGKTWEPGIVKAISTNKDLISAGISPYLIENEKQTVQNYLDTSFITTLTRQPYWTNFFFGDWDLHLPITSVDRQIDRDAYTIISGGQKLPPLRVNSDGSYSWVINKNKIIKGVWKRNNNAPGIILLSGDKSDNWLMYNSTDDTNKKIHKTDYIILSPLSEKYSAKHGFRVIKKK
jgi:hypothetical protein